MMMMMMRAPLSTTDDEAVVIVFRPRGARGARLSRRCNALLQEQTENSLAEGRGIGSWSSYLVKKNREKRG